MNFADIENAWRSPDHRPDSDQLNARRGALLAELRRRRRRQTIFLGTTLALLILLTGAFAWRALGISSPPPPFAFEQEWGILPFFALPWIGWFLLLRLNRRHAAGQDLDHRPISASIEAALAENHAERLRHGFIAGLLVVSAAVLPFVVSQLQAVGKAGPELELPAYIIYPAYVAAVVAALIVRHRRTLKPRQRTLETLLATYRDATE